MKYCLYLSILYFISSCYSPREIDYLTQCYNGRINKIDSLCNIQGYYFGNFSNNKNGGYSIMIFKDGTIAQNIHLGTRINEVQIGDYLYNNKDAWGTFIIKKRTIVSKYFIDHYHLQVWLSLNSKLLMIQQFG